MNWIQHPLAFEGERVKLAPLSEQYFDELVAISTDPKVWEFLAIRGWEREEHIMALKSALLNRLNGDEYPFVIIDKLKGNVIGCTRYMEMSQQFRKLEIGWTWYDPAYWGSGHNNECKLLLLTYAFETLHCIRVQLKTWDKNLRSRAAILKIGAQFEGILRNERIRFNEHRNTAMFSIIDTEWPGVKLRLQAKLRAER